MNNIKKTELIRKEEIGQTFDEFDTTVTVSVVEQTCTYENQDTHKSELLEIAICQRSNATFQCIYEIWGFKVAEIEELAQKLIQLASDIKARRIDP